MFRPEKKEVPEKARLAQKSKDAVFFFFVAVSFLCEKKEQNQEGAKLSIVK